jgi:hypothetical protein
MTTCDNRDEACSLNGTNRIYSRTYFADYCQAYKILSAFAAYENELLSSSCLYVRLYSWAVFSLEPLAQDPEITDKCYVNLFTPLTLPCSALTEA